jgi:hypothetical protein
MNRGREREYRAMSVAPAATRPRPRNPMSETGDPGQNRVAPRVEDIERALVLAREVASATAKGGAANLRVDHLRALFPNGSGPPSAERIQAALEAAGLTVDPPLADEPDSVSLRVERGRAALSPSKPEGGGRSRSTEPQPKPKREPDDDAPARPSGVAAYAAAVGRARRRRAQPVPDGVTLADAERTADAQQADLRTPQSIAALMPALILPVLAASFLGPVFGAIFAGLALLTSAMLSRPNALADGKLGPLRMPASLARSFLLVSSGIAIGALGMSIALIAAGGTSSDRADPNAPLGGEQRPAATSTTTPPAPTSATTAPSAPDQAAERKAAADRKARADRRAKRREQARKRRQRAQQQQSGPPSAGGTAPAP